MTPSIPFGSRRIGPDHPVVAVAELGINANGDALVAIEMAIAAHAAGASAVKFQAGDPERYVTRDHWDAPRETPWGTMRYIDYRRRMEFSDHDFKVIDTQLTSRGIPWFVSPLDAHSVERFERYNLPAYKVASPKLTDTLLLQRLAATGRTVLISTGMSTTDDIDRALAILPRTRVGIFQCTSAYPCSDDETNVRAVSRLAARYPDISIGYSGHEKGIWPTLAAVALGASMVERHFTTDRSAYGSDQAASLEPSGFSMLVRGIRSIEQALMGDGQKSLRHSEMANYRKFRSVA